MNILREVRRINKKSMPLRIILLLTFSVIFIVTTYAWFSTQKDVKYKGLSGDVTSWDVSYYVNSDTDEILDEIAVFTIDELYPGMPDYQDVVHIYNIGEASTAITYDVVSVKIFGEEVIDSITIQKQGNTVKIFSADTQYPFYLNYTYDKTKLIGQYEVGGTYENSAKATCTFNGGWEFGGDETKNSLDTQFGKGAYEFYQNPANDKSKAIEVKVRIKSSMIHPSEDPDFPYD